MGLKEKKKKVLRCLVFLVTVSESLCGRSGGRGGSCVHRILVLVVMEREPLISSIVEDNLFLVGVCWHLCKCPPHPTHDSIQQHVTVKIFGSPLGISTCCRCFKAESKF